MEVLPPQTDRSSPDDLVEFLQRVTRRIARRLPRHVEFKDMVSAGAVGLMEALRRFDPAKSAPFERFAEQRVRGAIVDYLRSEDPLPRSMRRLSNNLRHATFELEGQLGRAPTSEDLAAWLGVEMAELHRQRASLVAVPVLRIVHDDAGADENEDDGGAVPSPEGQEEGGTASFDDPFELACRRESSERVLAAVRVLPERMRQVVLMYHWEDLSLREIGAALGVTESRASQIHTQALTLLRDALGPKAPAPGRPCALARTRAARPPAPAGPRWTS